MAIRLFHGARPDGDGGGIALFVLQMEEVVVAITALMTMQQLPSAAGDRLRAPRYGSKALT
jgi:hypothetical protein